MNILQRALFPAALTLTLGYAATAFGDGANMVPAKIGPSLSRLTAAHGYGASAVRKPFVPAWLLKRDAGRLSVVILTGDPEKTAKAVRNNGGTVGTVTKSVVTAVVPLASVQSILRDPSVRFIDVPAEKHLKLNASNPEVGAGQVVLGTELPQGIDGTGVILGLVDTGIDITHTDFKKVGGGSRVKYLWNQSYTPAENPPPEYGYGMECSGASLDQYTCPGKDIIGHGTHCSGIMGGREKKYPGMATGAWYVVAGGLTNVVDGAAYVMKRADNLGMPVTINMSLGWHQGAHDGSSPEEIALGEMTKTPGHIIVAAAGNEGSDYIHLGYAASSTAKKTLLEVRVDGITTNAATLDSWSKAGTAVEYAVGIADGIGAEIVETDYYNSEAGSGAVQQELASGGVSYGVVQFESQLYGENGKYDTVIDIVPNRSNPDTTYGNKDGFQYYIKARGNGWFDSWIASESALSRGPSFSKTTGDGLVPGDNDRSLGMPAASPDIIAVAAYSTKVTWRDIDQVQRTVNGTVGDITYFSSHGPSGDEVRTGFKPEIAAPGQMIASAMAVGSISLSAGTQIDETHVMMQGTSMACPHVNGIVAMMLQADPKLTVEKVRRILMKTAAKDTFTGTTQNYVWGAGKVRALPAVKMALGIGICDTQDDCKEGRTCNGGLCMQNKGGKCYSAADCLGGIPCTEGICGGGQADGGSDAGGDGGGESGSGCGCSTVGLE